MVSYDKKTAEDLRIYVIDKDAVQMARLLDCYLELVSENYGVECGVQLSAHESLDEGLAAVNGDPNTLVLCGVMGNGIETALGGVPWATKTPPEMVEAIKGSNPYAKVFFVSSLYSLEEAIAAGADGFIAKPYRPQDLMKTIFQMYGSNS